MTTTARLAVGAGAVLVAALRWWFCVSSPAALHPVDPAELELLWLAQQVSGEGLSAEGLLRQLGRGDTVFHGGFLPVSLTVLAASAVVGPTYAAIKLSAVAWSTAIWSVWTLLALRLGGTRAGLVAGIALALPVPWATQWWLTGWGSHSEVGLLLGLALLGWGHAWLTGALAGLAAAFAPVVVPSVAVLLGLRRRWSAVGAAALAFALMQLGRPWWRGASLTEDPGQTVGGLLREVMAPGELWASLGAHLPLPLVASEAVPAWLAWPLMVGLLGAAVVLWRRGGVARWLVVLPVVHVAAVVVLSPFRPALHHRYLLPWLPAVLLWPALAAGGRVWVPWAVLGLVPSLLAVPVMAGLEQGGGDYRPLAYLSVGLDRVPGNLETDVNVFLDARGDSATPGFAAAWTRRWGYPTLGESFPDVAVRSGLRGRLVGLAAEGHDLDRLARDAGWGLAVVSGWDAAAVNAALAPLGELEAAARAGAVEGAEASGRSGLGVELGD